MEQLRSRSRSSSAPSRKRHSKQWANGEETPRGHTTTPSTTECAVALQTIHSGPGANPAAASAATTRSPAQAADGRPRRPRRLRSSPASWRTPASGGTRTRDSDRARPGRAANRLPGTGSRRVSTICGEVDLVMRRCSASWRDTGRAHRTAREGLAALFAPPTRGGRGGCLRGGGASARRIVDPVGPPVTPGRSGG